MNTIQEFPTVTQEVVTQSARFIKEITSALPEGVDTLTVQELSIVEASGVYEWLLDMEANGTPIVLAERLEDPNDYEKWCNYPFMNQGHKNWIKRQVVGMIGSGGDDIIEQLEEANE